MTDEHQALREAVRDLRTSIDHLRSELVRRDVYDADQRGIVARFAVLEKDVAEVEVKVDKGEERRAADRRLILTSLVLPILVALVLLYVTSQVGAQ